MIMCEICGQYFCYPSCPFFDGTSAELGKRLFRCALCKENIYETDDYTIYNGKAYCSVCSREGKMNGGQKNA